MNAISFALVLFGVLLNAAAQLLLKAGTNSIGHFEFSGANLVPIGWKVATQPYILGGLMCYAISVVVWIMALSRVEVSVGGGWQAARLVTERQRHSWQWWELITRVAEPGVVTLRARATDLAGRTQPEHAEWNRLGYGNNSIHQVPIRIT